MPEDRVSQVSEETGSISSDVYPILGSESGERKITLWQPAGYINDIYSLPAPEGMKPKSQSFLNRAQGSHLAVAPEWSYNVDWVREHEDELFADDSPLFILGCRPIEIDDMKNIITDFEEYGFNLVQEGVPDHDSKEFVTPTIVPLRADALRSVDSRTVVIQYKTRWMSEGANPNEAENLATGNLVYEIESSTGDSVVVWTCSDLLNQTLRRKVSDHAHAGKIVVHPQCNPEPFHTKWTEFRSNIFSNTNDTAYICANWGEVTADSDISEAQWGYSGVYTGAHEWSSLENYSHTYKMNGLSGIDYKNCAEYVWTLVDDGVCRLSVRRRGNRSEPARGRRPEPHIQSAWEWDAADEEYATSVGRVDECGCQMCDDCDCAVCDDCRRRERETQLPNSPCRAELITAVTFCWIDIDEIDSLDSPYDVPLAALENLRARNNERLGHAFAAHDHRRGDSVAKNTKRLLNTFDIASDQFHSQIKPTDCTPTDLPLNATAGERNDLDVSLSLLDSPTSAEEQQWIADVVRWREFQEDHRFKPLALTQSVGETKLKVPDELEDVMNGDVDPEDVTAKNPPVQLAEVDR